MSFDYLPNPLAIPDRTEATRQLSQRDVSIRIPVNYVTTPAVALTPACFAHRRYEDSAAIKCFSNLLAIGFQRFELDVYWDITRSVWSLCPVQLGSRKPEHTETSSPLPTVTNTPTGLNPINITAISSRPVQSQASSVALTAGVTTGALGLLNRSPELLERQTGSSVRSLSYPTTQTNAISSHDAKTSASTTVTLSSASSSGPTPTAASVLEIGSYSCSESIDFTLFTGLLASHLNSTQTDLNATLKYVIFHLHSAANNSDVAASLVLPQDLPRNNDTLGSVVDSTLGTYLYTPAKLESQRADLNASGSWNSGIRSSQPDATYFEVNDANGHKYTPNGWPSESFVELQNAQRLFVGLGRVDPQMQFYSPKMDSSIIFSNGYLERHPPFTADSAGTITSGCFFDANVTSLATSNNSWAVVEDGNNILEGADVIGPLFEEAGNLTNCGISPLLNRTLDNKTADQDFRPYNHFVQKTIWSWEPTEPHNTSSLDQDFPREYRCAVLVSSTGSWRVTDCGDSHYTACRRQGEIYSWEISNNEASYARANLPCPDGSYFTVPHTALENRHLLSTWRDARIRNNIDDEFLWINFNDLDVYDCWVAGQNNTCPYLGARKSERQIIVPVVAAVIVFVLAALTICTKCASNRQTSKRRRSRGDNDGWEYESVPS